MELNFYDYHDFQKNRGRGGSIMKNTIVSFSDTTIFILYRKKKKKCLSSWKKFLEQPQYEPGGINLRTLEAVIKIPYARKKIFHVCTGDLIFDSPEK